MFEPDLNEELKALLESDRLAALTKTQGSIFALSEPQAEIEREANRMAKLRSLADKVKDFMCVFIALTLVCAGSTNS